VSEDDKKTTSTEGRDHVGNALIVLMDCRLIPRLLNPWHYLIGGGPLDPCLASCDLSSLSNDQKWNEVTLV
jgi:hypothetical protein